MKSVFEQDYQGIIWSIAICSNFPREALGKFPECQPRCGTSYERIRLAAGFCRAFDGGGDKAGTASVSAIS
jgi:hypothetical protein